MVPCQICANKPAWRRLKSIARAQEQRAVDADECVTILDEVMELMPKAKTFISHMWKSATNSEKNNKVCQDLTRAVLNVCHIHYGSTDHWLSFEVP